MKTQNIIRLLFTFTLLFSLVFSQTSQTTEKFYEIDQNVRELRAEMNQLRRLVREIEIRSSAPAIRDEINKLIQIPEITHEIVLKNGTIVKGKILHEDIDKMIIQTQIGQLTIFKNKISLTKKVEPPHAKCIIDGAITENIYQEKRIYKGKLKNDGARRADFPRVIFKLYDESANIIARDSTFIEGTYHLYESGVQSDGAIDPGESFTFECSIAIPESAKPVSYYVKEVIWEEF